MKRLWYMKCTNCGAYRKDTVNVLIPCEQCGMVVMWEKAFEVEYTCGKDYRVPNS